MIEPARRQNRQERFLDLRAGARDRRLEDADLALDRRRAFGFERAAHHGALGRAHIGALAGDEEHRLLRVHRGIEFGKVVALAGAQIAGGDFAGGERPRRQPLEMRRVMPAHAVRGPELAVVDDVDAAIDLAPHDLGDDRHHHGVELLRIGHIRPRQPCRQIGGILGRGQPADMRGADAVGVIAHGASPP